MNFGYTDIQNIIYENAIRMKYPSSSKFAKDTAKLIWKMIEEKEGKMDNTWNEAHGFPSELEPLVRRIENGLGINMMRTDKTIELYRWIIEQEQSGMPLQKFIDWAVSNEQVKYVSKYRFNPGLIKTNWRLAHESNNTNNPLGLEVGI